MMKSTWFDEWNLNKHMLCQPKNPCFDLFNTQGSRVRPNFSRVRLTKIWGCVQPFEKKNKKSPRLSLPVLQQQTHIRLISWSKPIRDSEVQTSFLEGRAGYVFLKGCHYFIFIPLTDKINCNIYKGKQFENLAALKLGMGTEIWYLIGLGAKLWKTGVSISSVVNGSAIGTGEIKKTHIHVLLIMLYIYIFLQILSRQSHQLFLYAIIFKLLYMMHFCYSQFRSEIAHVEEFQHAQHKSAVYDRRELTIKTCLHFRPVAVILNWVYLMFFWLLRIIAEFLLAQLPSLHSGAHSFLPDQNLTSESDAKHVKTAGLESLHLNTVYVLKWTRTVGRKLCVLCQYFVLVTDWCFINVNQSTKTKSLTARAGR